MNIVYIIVEYKQKSSLIINRLLSFTDFIFKSTVEKSIIYKGIYKSTN